MRISNFAKGQQAAGFFRLCICILISLTLAMGGMALNTGPVRAALDINPSPLAANLTECVPYTITFNPTGQTCPGGPPFIYFYWFSGAPPPWVTLDMNTGVLTACPPVGSAGVYNFGVGVTELWPGPVPPPCATPSPISNVTLTVLAGAGCNMVINPTFYPVAWENMLFSMSLSVTGGVGPFTWSATGLPAGLSVTDATNGIISGAPAPGTCGTYTVTAQVTDLGTCCCLPVNRPFILIVDCWANYVFFTYTTSCDFTVQIGPGLTQGQTKVVISGNLEATIGGGQSQTFTSQPCQDHLVVVDQIVPGADPKTRFVVKGSNSKMVTDTDNLALFDYAQEAYIETSSDPIGVPKPPGTGWYAMGGYFSTTTPSPVDFDNQKGVKYLFRAWSLPDGSTSPTRDLVFTVNKAGTATAVYDTYYLLQLKSDNPPFDESSWELKNSTATYDLALPEVPMNNIFGAIGGKRVPINPKGSHLMTGPYTQKLLFRDDYTIPLVIVIVVVVVTLLVIAGVIFLVLRRKRVGVSAVPATTVAQVPQPPAVAPEAAKITPAVTATVEKKALTEAESAEKANFCPKCGAPVEKDADFCKKCGRKLVKNDK